MREKLIELIRQGNGGYDFNSIELIADHLIANGVVVLDVTQDVTQNDVDFDFEAEDV